MSPEVCPTCGRPLDLVQVCLGCGRTFSLSQNDVAFYTARALKTPKRCASCRRERRLNQNKNGAQQRA